MRQATQELFRGRIFGKWVNIEIILILASSSGRGRVARVFHTQSPVYYVCMCNGKHGNTQELACYIQLRWIYSEDQVHSKTYWTHGRSNLHGSFPPKKLYTATLHYKAVNRNSCMYVLWQTRKGRGSPQRAQWSFISYTRISWVYSI